MTKDSVNIRIHGLCPSCKKSVVCDGFKDESGLVHPPMPMPKEILFEHKDCDLRALVGVLSKSAWHQSKVTTFNIVTGEEQ